MGSTAPKQPLVVIVGATGTGKSKLAVDLATRFNGEIINADAVQMYRGLPIITNKIPENERNGIRHHLLDQIELHEQPWTVHEFVDESSRIIQQIRDRGKLPIVVGGTTYYIFSLLFRESTVNNVVMPTNDHGAMGAGNTDLSILERSNEEIFAKLQQVDPEIATTWHPNDRRKIQRSLEIYLRTGRKASEIYAEQAALKATNEAHMSFRYEPLIFWLKARHDVLKTRLNDRVDEMVQRGLLEEARSMREFERRANSQGQQIATTKGLWVAIGYKELAPWLDALEANEDAGGSAELAQLQQVVIESVKSATRQYAREQERWVRIRLANTLNEAAGLDRLLLLDSTNVDAWFAAVTEPSQQAVSSFLAGSLKDASVTGLAEQATRLGQLDLDKPRKEAHFCEMCQKILMDEREWARHLKSNHHKKVLEAKRKREKRDAYLAKMAAVAEKAEPLSYP